MSVALDTMRIASAGIVFIMHANMQWHINPAAALHALPHAAVVVFFIISGYVIAFTTLTTNRGLKQYATARLSRLYSLVLPALLLTVAVQIIVKKVNPSLAMLYHQQYSWLRYAISAVYCNESTLLSASPSLNTPLWSLSFEFWYYVIFGLWFFRKSIRYSRPLMVAAGCVAGPKILVMLPIWLFGVVGYRVAKPAISVPVSWVAVVLLLALGSGLAIYMPALPFSLGYKPLYFANQFIKDWLVGLSFALALWLVPETKGQRSSSWITSLRVIADLSFPIYVFHFPLLILWRAVVGWQPGDVRGMWSAVVFVGAAAILMGIFFERQRVVWIRFFKYLFTSPRLSLINIKTK